MLASNDSLMSYRRIRAPKKHGEALHLPTSKHWNSVWNKNIQTSLNSAKFESGSLKNLRSDARHEIKQLAFEFTRQYRDVDLADRRQDHVLMAGHQPQLFHAGVWYKNFVLSSLGRKLNAIAINLIVDNDICNASYINVPSNSNVKRIFFDSNSAILPFEERAIEDRDSFRDFAASVTQTASSNIQDPIIQKLWPHVMKQSEDGNLGIAFAKGRHQFESDFGLQTLELPISKIAQTKSFAVFFREILCRIVEFNQIYNASVVLYRKVHKIKSNAHPVPELATNNDWIETPFWIWTERSPQRKSLFTKVSDKSISLTDRGDINIELESNMDFGEFHKAINDRFKVRPKALMTTMFSRLIGSDMFIHGIGGSKYDQITDVIAKQFFHVELPSYLTVTGTFVLQPNHKFLDTNDISETRQKIRQLRFHPEQFIESPNDQAASWIQNKQHWIRASLPLGKRLPRHQAIEESNLALQPFVEPLQRSLQKELAEMRQRHIRESMLSSREYSFCLHDQSIVEELKNLADASMKN